MSKRASGPLVGVDASADAGGALAAGGVERKEAERASLLSDEEMQMDDNDRARLLALREASLARCSSIRNVVPRSAKCDARRAAWVRADDQGRRAGSCTATASS